jgi:hypothetical protein
MVRKKMEGDEAQRRRAAHEAHRSGSTPSAESRTTGASKQPTHLTHRDAISHDQRLETRHRGKQGGERPEGARAQEASAPDRSVTGRGAGPYTEAHEQVFQALTQTQQEHQGEAVHLDEVARASGLPREETTGLLHDLVTVHGLATQLAGSDSPDMGPRFEVRPGL